MNYSIVRPDGAVVALYHSAEAATSAMRILDLRAASPGELWRIRMEPGRAIPPAPGSVGALLDACIRALEVLDSCHCDPSAFAVARVVRDAVREATGG